MNKALLVTGASGLVGSECVRFFARKGFCVFGIDNDMRKYFFGPAASVEPIKQQLIKEVPLYRHFDIDIRDKKALTELFSQNRFDCIIHAAAQPSHDWAARNPEVDFDINANGTRILLQSAERFCPDAVFIFISTNKVYGDWPNRLPLLETKTRFELSLEHPFYNGVDESMSIDNCMHSLYGASKLSADILVQEYGSYRGLKTGVFRAGCITGSQQAGVPLHGFLSYLVRCCVNRIPYTINGYKGKQVRDNIHAADVAGALYQFYSNPRTGEVYNIGGSRFSNASVLEAIAVCESACGRKMDVIYSPKSRKGDHMWWISDCSKFKKEFPSWKLTHTTEMLIEEIASQKQYTHKA